MVLLYSTPVDRCLVKSSKVQFEEARMILGDEASKMSDEQLQTPIDDLSVMAKWALEEAARIRTQEATAINDRSKNDSTEV